MNYQKPDTLNFASLCDDTDAVASLLSAMANPKRLMILCNLAGGEIAVGALAEKVGLSQSALSQHLSKLRALNLVSTRRDAQTIYYSSSSPQVRLILQVLEQIHQDNISSVNAA